MDRPMPIQRLVDYLNAPDDLLPTWQSLLLGAFKVILFASVIVSITTVAKKELKVSPLTTRAKVTQVSQPTASQTIFIVHGHDDLNTLRLEKLLRERWNLDSLILKFEPGRGRTLIEKFEEEAENAAYAVVLFTSDDLVEVAGTQYTQAKPNVIFELGWFYARLGRQRVCVLYKTGTKLPSDLNGITTIEFSDDVGERIGELENELRAAGLLS